MPAPPYWMVEGLTDEEKKEIFKVLKNRINEIYLKPELIGGGPNSYPKLINYFENRRIEMNIMGAHKGTNANHLVVDYFNTFQSRIAGTGVSA